MDALFAEEVISKPQYAEEFIKSFQFSLVPHIPASEAGLCAKQKSRRIRFVRTTRGLRHEK